MSHDAVQDLTRCLRAGSNKPSRVGEGHSLKAFEEASKGIAVGAPVIALVSLHEVVADQEPRHLESSFLVETLGASLPEG